jgi:hypothetical protein
MAELPLRVIAFPSAQDLRASCLLVLYNTSGVYGCLIDKRHQPRFAAGVADTIILSAHNYLVEELSSSADSALQMLFSHSLSTDNTPDYQLITRRRFLRNGSSIKAFVKISAI